MMKRALIPKNRREALERVRTYTVHYGRCKLETLEAYDMVIVEPTALTLEGIRLLQRRSTLVIAYISFMEIRQEDPVYLALAGEDWLQVEGAPVENTIYGNKLADLRSVRWTSMLMERVRKLLHEDGYDGIFIDTIGNVEWPSLPREVRKEQSQAAVKLIQSVKGFFKEYLLIQNNGVKELCTSTARWIDAVCWENPLFTEPHAEWSYSVAERLRRLTHAYGAFPRTLLLYEDHPERLESMRRAYQIAMANNWLFARCTRNYI